MTNHSPQHSEPKTAKEIERTYLLDGLPALPEHAIALELEQGYLPGSFEPGDDPAAIPYGRIRRTTHPDGRVVCTHTIKRGEGVEREETERTIDEEEFERLWLRTKPRQLRKTRYIVNEGGYTWEIDSFHELDLYLAEVEITNVDEQPPLPAWLEPHVVRDVTDEKQYENYELALRLASHDR